MPSQWIGRPTTDDLRPVHGVKLDFGLVLELLHEMIAPGQARLERPHGSGPALLPLDRAGARHARLCRLAPRKRAKGQVRRQARGAWLAGDVALLGIARQRLLAEGLQLPMGAVLARPEDYYDDE